MERSRRWLLLLLVLGIAIGPALDLRADDQFLAALSNIATREIRKAVRDKPIPFAQGPFKGHVHAIEPETRLTAEVQDFNLTNDLLTATVTARGRFAIEGTLAPEAEVRTVVDVQFTVTADVRFLKEGEKFFVEPKLHDIAAGVKIVEVSPADLSGGQELLSSLANAAFNKNKDKILAEANKRLGKRPF